MDAWSVKKSKHKLHPKKPHRARVHNPKATIMGESRNVTFEKAPLFNPGEYDSGTDRGNTPTSRMSTTIQNEQCPIRGPPPYIDTA